MTNAAILAVSALLLTAYILGRRLRLSSVALLITVLLYLAAAGAVDLSAFRSAR